MVLIQTSINVVTINNRTENKIAFTLSEYLNVVWIKKFAEDIE
jgi:hypothetical protein